MTFKTIFAAILGLTFFWVSSVQAQDDPFGEGIDSQTLWSSPGPSNFLTIQSSDIVAHKNVTFSALFDYARKPLPELNRGLENSTDSDWPIENAFYTDFMWAFGIADYFQLGLVLPVVLAQYGKGATTLSSDSGDYALAGSALRDLRFNLKTRFLGGKKANPDTRGLGLALDLGLAVPTGDEKNYAGNKGVVFFPTAVIDYHLCMFSVALNLGARIHSNKSDPLADFTTGHQGAFGLGLTGHFADRRFLLSGQGTGLIELDGFKQLGIDILGSIGFIPDESRAVTIWVAGGLSAATEEFIGAPKARVLIGLTYAPGGSSEASNPM